MYDWTMNGQDIKKDEQGFPFLCELTGTEISVSQCSVYTGKSEDSSFCEFIDCLWVIHKTKKQSSALSTLTQQVALLNRGIWQRGELLFCSTNPVTTLASTHMFLALTVYQLKYLKVFQFNTSNKFCLISFPAFCKALASFMIGSVKCSLFDSSVSTITVVLYKSKLLFLHLDVRMNSFFPFVGKVTLSSSRFWPHYPFCLGKNPLPT